MSLSDEFWMEEALREAQRALTLGKPVDPTTDLGKQFRVLAQSMVESPRPQSLPDQKKRFIEYFSLIPGRAGALASKTAS